MKTITNVINNNIMQMRLLDQHNANICLSSQLSIYACVRRVHKWTYVCINNVQCSKYITINVNKPKDEMRT